MKKTVIAAVALCLALAWWSNVKAAATRTAETMRFKLEYAQKVMEGIALEDYDLITFNAARLKALGQSADWRHRQNAEYQRHTGEFIRHAEALARAGERKNLDAATIAYFQLTMSCVQCHRYLRGSEQAGLEVDLRDRLLAGRP
jgi:hypothetical protein